MLPKPFPWRPGTAAWIEHGGIQGGMVTHLSNIGVQLTVDVRRAHCFFVPDITIPGERVSIMAGMQGGVIAAMTIALGQSGNFLSYRPARTKRVFYSMTVKFRAKHTAFADLFEFVCGQAGSEWRAVSRLKDLLRTAKQGVHATITLAVSAEADDVDRQIRSVPNVSDAMKKRHKVLTKPELFKFVMDCDFNATGYCRIG